MSIEILLEAAKFLEIQALQQQKAREDELKEKLCLQQQTEHRLLLSNNDSTIHNNHVFKGDERRTGPMPPSLPPPTMPITVIPFPVVTPNPTGSPNLPMATLSPPAASTLTSPMRDPNSPQEQSAAALLCLPQHQPDHSVVTVNHKQPVQNHYHHHPPPLIVPNNNNISKSQQKPEPQLVQRYPGSIVSPPPQAMLLHPGPVLQHTPPQHSPISRDSPDENRLLDGKKRPGGAGTREVHNKLEKHRRAILKECFETLKKNIPNIDEKKTSNLSVLRSALRYIQTLKRKEKEYEHDMERLAREKIATQQRLAELKNELGQWMDVVEIDRVLRQTVQPEEDQASTSTASEGEDVMDDEQEELPLRAQTTLPIMPHTMKPELPKPAAPIETLVSTPTTSIITQHVSFQHKAPPPVTPSQSMSKSVAPPTLTASICAPTHTEALLPTHTKMVTMPTLHPTVIAHASVSHPSVIQAVNHVIQGGAPKPIAHLVPPTTSTASLQLNSSHPPFSHITVHPVAHLSQHLPALYPQPLTVPQPAVVGHITHTLNHSHPQVNGAPQPGATIVGKSTQMLAQHPQLLGQTVLNPVTMVTMPSFPISTLKLA
ncbi:max-binding protein MNT isoform X2 [Gouania willdenowi]|uniref:Max-binding protein MNT n=1 Tax=Gouania willdenowi TaxID=441366 RepID=A0A8C5EXN3_GOUWI|nr:max-binding protein MNT-like isoform X2 [Gouania willdenowi]